MMNPEAVYHYTTGKALGDILQAACIRTSPSFSHSMEKAVVWCSVREDWEPSAACIHALPDGRVVRRSREEIRRAEGGLGRIRIASGARLFTWEQYKRISKISNRHLRILSRFAEDCGADTRQWRVCFNPIPAALWETVEMQHPESGNWIDHPVQKKAVLAATLREVRAHIPFLSFSQRRELHSHLKRLMATCFT
ncbi:hypothetical protein OOT00_04910 [Desulfobotulus sp. H1]|uniref:Uncharacterized protein n=1 Tax=Desulfobotulus pelophilus TaxID=2823377 RepID=A0ABT3N785_9BACT|nr:hypothetical protein [Desulfobotulus pelophilus]MCW7753325.1 hypothetical protein [Desulfobotulus pelophilus]